MRILPAVPLLLTAVQSLSDCLVQQRSDFALPIVLVHHPRVRYSDAPVSINQQLHWHAGEVILLRQASTSNYNRIFHSPRRPSSGMGS